MAAVRRPSRSLVPPRPLEIRYSASTTCFHYGASGERCGERCLDPLFLCCATHFYEYTKTPVPELLQQAAKAISECTRFTDQGLPYLACTHLPSWKRLANALRALSAQGYQDPGELLTALVSALESLERPYKDVSKSHPRKGKPFERLVARMYLEELAPLVGPTPDSESSIRVLWDKRIPSKTGKKRQIDVLLRWKRGDIENLTIVECRDHEVEVSEMDAFATLIRHTGATRGVMVSSIGFQSGAQACAQIEGIETRIVTEEDFSPETVVRDVESHALEMSALQLAPDSAPLFGLLPHQIQVMKAGVITGTLDQLLREAVDTRPPKLGTMPPRIDLDTPGLQLLLPDGRTTKVTTVSVHLRVIERAIQRTLTVPRHPIAFSVRASTPMAPAPEERTRHVDADSLPLWASLTFEPHQFYVNLLGQSYYCEKVGQAEDKVELVLLADRQHGHVIDVVAHASLDQAEHYYPVEDKAALRSLKKRLARFRRISAPKHRDGGATKPQDGR